MTDKHNDETPSEEPQVVVRDRRRIDPETGEVRGAADSASAAPAPGGDAAQDDQPVAEVVEPELVEAEVIGAEPVADPAAEVKAQLDERTADLQRLQAEYANYRKRVERDRESVVAGAKAAVAADFLSVVDDLERAEAHGDLTGAFKAVADKFTAVLSKTGLEAFGHEGEPFDPSVHEAVQHSTSTEVDGPTVTGVLRRGYRIGDRVVRAALVAVTDAETAPAAQAD